MTDDAELLRKYVEFHSNTDFTEFVGRHFSFVYHAALRRTGGRADLAQDVTQYVFTTVARRASALREHRVLAGWLYTTTRLAANNILREERRRSAREQEAHLMSDASSPNSDPQWHRVREELDSVMDQLPERDREAILLRFFHNRPFAQIGAAFGLSEDAARKRVDRALERLRECLVKRGITSTSAALGAMLAGEAALAAPAGMAKSVAGAALAQAAELASPLIGALQLMTTKTTLGIAGTLGLAGLLVITAIGVAVHYTREARQAEAAVALAQRDHRPQAASLAQLRRDADQAAAAVAEAQRALEKLQATARPRETANSATSAAGSVRDPRADAAKFLTMVGPARAMITQAFKGVVPVYKPYFYRIANFSPEQIEDFENLEAAFRLESLGIRNGSWYAAQPNSLPLELVEQRFGPEVAQKLKDYKPMYWGYAIATEVAQAVAYTSPPISDDQARLIARAVADNNSDYRAGKNLTLANLKTAGQDWNAVVTAVKGVLSPEQWAAAEAVFVEQQYRQALEQATQAMMATAPIRPKS